MNIEDPKNFKPNMKIVHMREDLTEDDLGFSPPPQELLTREFMNQIIFANPEIKAKALELIRLHGLESDLDKKEAIENTLREILATQTK